MHARDFSTELDPTRGQWKRIALELLRLAGESAPGSRRDATVLLLRLDQSEPGEPASAAAAYGLTPAEQRGVERARPSANGDRAADRRTGARA